MLCRIPKFFVQEYVGQGPKELSNATFVALIDLKLAKMDLKNALTLRGRFLDGQVYPTPYSERELRQKRLIAERNLRKCRMIFDALWKARRRAQRILG